MEWPQNRRKRMEEKLVTVEEVREAQEFLKAGIELHEKKEFKQAIEAFRKTSSIHMFEATHLDELEKKLKAGDFKKQQESIAYMGCAAVHLNTLIQNLDEDQKAEVPVDEQLMAIFKEWQ